MTRTKRLAKKKQPDRTIGDSRIQWVAVPALDAALDGRADLRNVPRDKVIVPEGLVPLLTDLRVTSSKSRARYFLDRLEALQRRLSMSPTTKSTKHTFQMNPKEEVTSN